jgi:hypothetical protein
MWRRLPAQSETVIGDDLFLVAPGRDGAPGEIVHLDLLAAALWRLLDVPHDLAAIHGIFAAAWPDVPAAKLHADIATALNLLAAEGLAREG